ncbi:DUF6345 domain-containing protein [Kribbella sp. CWNU-51]
MAVRVGVAWATYFQRKPYQFYPRLRYAYKPPSLFLQAMIEAGDRAKWLGSDEQLVTSCFDPQGRAQQVDILYLSSHGLTGASGFEVALHAGDWPLFGGGFGDTGPTVVVFDCCELADVQVPNWKQDWETALLGQGLRLVLGFSTKASGSRKAAARGTGFADELIASPNQSIKEAWFTAIHNSTSTNEEPVAIAFGDSDADAQDVLDTMSIGSLYGPRANTVPTVRTEP